MNVVAASVIGDRNTLRKIFIYLFWTQIWNTQKIGIRYRIYLQSFQKELVICIRFCYVVR